MAEDPTKGWVCKACEIGSWKGPRTIPVYQCDPCVGDGKIYDTNSKPQWKCTCDKANDFVVAGDSCILETTAAKITASYPEDDRVEYKDVETATNTGV